MRIIIISCILFLAISCGKENIMVHKDTPSGNGFYVINEGNFGWGNASLGFVNDSFGYTDKVFENVNGTKLGDVFQNLYEWEDKYYLVVNNSNKIEVIDKVTHKSLFAVKALNNPRYMTVAAGKGYVNDLFTDEVVVFDLHDGSKLKTLKLGGRTDRVYAAGEWVFCVVNKKVYKIDPNAMEVKDSIDWGMEVMELATDQSSMVFAIAKGERDSIFVLQLDKESLQVKNKRHFPMLPSQPSNPIYMTVNTKGAYIMYSSLLNYMEVVDQEVKTWTGNVTGLGNLYGFNVHPKTGNFYFCNAKDYASNGEVIITSATLELIKKVKVGVIPNACYFVNE